ncbi:MAG: 2OG-Fe(II) oxygenase [Chitinophagaceae bacterium]
MKNQFDEIIDSYLENKVGIDTCFMTERLSDGLQANILQLQNNGQLTPAGIGNDVLKYVHQQTRGDKICWLDKQNHNPFEDEFLHLAEDFIAYLNATCYTGINACEFHYAVYEEGSFYKRHKDQFKNNSNRKYSLISYLNTGWLEEDGGQLMIYREKEIQRILPQSQKAVFFKSDEMEHEVAVTSRRRLSVTGWLKCI